MDLMKTGGGPGVLSSLPSTLYRWTEECRVLDGSSVHDVITGMCSAAGFLYLRQFSEPNF